MLLAVLLFCHHADKFVCLLLLLWHRPFAVAGAGSLSTFSSNGSSASTSAYNSGAGGGGGQ